MRGMVCISVLLVAALSLSGLGNNKVAVVYPASSSGYALPYGVLDMARTGWTQASEDQSVTVKEVPVSQENAYSELRRLSEPGDFGVIVCLGSAMETELWRAASDFPAQRFALVEGEVDASNVMCVLIDGNQEAVLAGVLAGMLAAQAGEACVGITWYTDQIRSLAYWQPVSETVRSYEFGVNLGVQLCTQLGLATTSSVEVLSRCISPLDTAENELESARDLLRQGAIAVYAAEGVPGQGTLRAIGEAHASAETAGILTPPYYFGPAVEWDFLASASYSLVGEMARVDVETYYAVTSVVLGTFESGTTYLGVSNGGLSIAGLADIRRVYEAEQAVEQRWKDNLQSVHSEIWDTLLELQMAIASGLVRLPSPGAPPPPLPDPCLGECMRRYRDCRDPSGDGSGLFVPWHQPDGGASETQYGPLPWPSPLVMTRDSMWLERYHAPCSLVEECFEHCPQLVEEVTNP